MYTKSLRDRVRQRRDAVERLRLALALDTKARLSDADQSSLTLYAASIGPLHRGHSRAFGRRVLMTWCARRDAVLGQLVDGHDARLALPTNRGVEVRRASGALGGIQVRPVAGFADALLLAVLEDLRVVGIEALTRCGHCGRLGLRLRQGGHPACSARCAQALRTKKYRQEHRDRFRASRQKAYREAVARRLKKPVENVKVQQRRHKSQPHEEPPKELVDQRAAEALARHRAENAGESPGEAEVRRQRAREPRTTLRNVTGGWYTTATPTRRIAR